MTGVRQSVVWGLEGKGNFGKGLGANFAWLKLPPGSKVSSTHQRSTNRIDTVGTKKWDTIVYGRFSGSWDWTFVLDYNYLEPLALAFEGTDYSGALSEGGNGVSVDSETRENETVYTYTFEKSELDRVPSFCFRRKILHRIAGGDYDETMELRGCVCKTIKFSISAGSSQVDVSMSGFYVREVADFSDLESTDYEEKSGQNPVQFVCFAYGPMDKTESGKRKGKHVANVDTISMSIDNSASTIDSTCTPFSPFYYEGKSNFTFSAQCYYNDGVRLTQPLYHGGRYDVDEEGAVKYDTTGYLAKTPLCKGLAPMQEAHAFSFEECKTSEDETAYDVYDRSPCRVDFKFTQAVIKTKSWPRGDSGKLQESLSSVECRDIVITISTKKQLQFGSTARNAISAELQSVPARVLPLS